MVGYKFCEKFIAKTKGLNYKLTVFGEEPRPAYDRVHLSDYFSSRSEQALIMAPRTWYEEAGITLHTGELVTTIEVECRLIRTQKGKICPYDYLVLATGSYAFVPPIGGTEKQGVFVYRTIEDLEAILAYGRKIAVLGNAKVAVLGGGLLGLEAAKAVLDMGLEPYVVEFAPRLMPQQLDDAGASVLQDKLQSLGIRILTKKNTTHIGGEERITHLQFADGERVDVQMLIVSAGIRPRDELARNSGLTMGTRGGVVVNDRMQTSAANIYAIGEVALYNDRIYGLVAPGYEMAEVAADQILGGEKVMAASVDTSTKLKLIGLDVASFGNGIEDSDTLRNIVFQDKLAGIYKRINVSADAKKLLGGILVGDAKDYNLLLQIMQNNMPLPPKPEDLILGPRNGESGGAGSVLDFPENALICSCESVTKGAILSAVVEQGCENIQSVSRCTKAGTGCGGCKPMVQDLVVAAVQSLGKTVKKAICEHFPFSRQELYDIIKIKGLRTFEEVLDQQGQGDGCELCKPALASIFASLFNEIATVQESIQDTNDRFLANIQRNGSYSVVPRMAAGEVTPDKLIAIGMVAKKYGLYTKITGGQRVDLFGAKVNDLPNIWEELIEAGFESGHAYGKALRTIKSCVGSTWCRYGLDESVSFAVELENRYKGLRAPHKIKGGVSGCIRECAEARSKDFGVIATEKGWNLYVCGNGGAKPKHAVLLAENINNHTCIKLIDRFLIFYIRTADPLTRTATWLEKLPGGIDYLRQVVVQDCLGLAVDMEKEMDSLVASYQCEWKAVVEEPALRSRFSHFVNSNEEDDNMKFVPLREQQMPAPWK